jgi:dihydroorotate dehydrogenase electron transfer subunit
MEDEMDGLLPQVLYIEHGEDIDTPMLYPSPTSWHPGCRIIFRGPQGHGFSVPSLLRRIAMIGFDNHPSRLMPLVQSGLIMKADIVIAGDFHADPDICKDIPPQIELADTDQIQDLLSWADLTAIDVSMDRISQLGELTTKFDKLIMGKNIQVLVHTSMPCGGIAECGICAIKTVQGYKLACQEGPVFNLAELKFS